jgi:hypothetical protein
MTGSYWSATQAGTNSGATATQAADTVGSRAYVVTCVSGHLDADAIITVKDGTTIIWEAKIDVSVEGFSFHFPNLSLPCSLGALTEAEISASTADCQVTISGEF